MRSFFMMILLGVSLFAQNEFFNDIAKKIAMIENGTQKMDQKSINITYDPFVVKSKIVKKEEMPQDNSKNSKKIVKKMPKKLLLSMIFNKKAFISGKWYKEKERLNDYMISKINSNNVILRKKSKTIMLKLSSSRNVLMVKD
jgi:hypothetical protein